MSSAVAGYKATLGADAPPCSYEDLDHAGTVFIAGSNLAWAHPILMRRLEDARRARPDQKWIVVDPRRTETAEAADLHLQILPGTDVALFNGLAHLLLWEGLADRRFIDAHTAGFDALRDAVRNCTPALTAQLCGIREDALVQAARWFGGPSADAVAVLPGPEPELERHRQERGADQPAPAHRPDRQGGCGAVLADRPAQCDGRTRGRRPGQPAVGAPRPGQPRAPRRSGRAVGPGRGGHSVAPGPHRGGDVPGRRRRRGQGAVDRLHQPRAVAARPGDGAARARALPVRRGAGGLCHHRHRAPCRPAAAGHHLGRERKAPSPTASAASAACARPCRHPARRAPTGRSRCRWRAAWRRFGRRVAPTAARFSPTTAPRRCGTNIAPPPAGATSTSPACHGRCSKATDRSSGPARRAPPRGAPGCTRTAASPRPTAVRALPRCRHARRRKSATRTIPLRSPPVGCATSGTAPAAPARWAGCSAMSASRRSSCIRATWRAFGWPQVTW